MRHAKTIVVAARDRERLAEITAAARRSSPGGQPVARKLVALMFELSWMGMKQLPAPSADAEAERGGRRSDWPNERGVAFRRKMAAAAMLIGSAATTAGLILI